MDCRSIGVPRLLWSSILLLAAAGAVAEGRIEGRVIGAEDEGVGGVEVVLDPGGRTAMTAGDGRFSIERVTPGSYTVRFTLGGESAEAAGVEVIDGATARVRHEVDWQVSFAESMTVTSASRRRERIVDAPAAVTTVSRAELELQAPTGQLPRMLEFAPGVEVAQSGLFDFNLNVRGLNASLNRRVQPRIDGRDPTLPFLGNTEWAFLSNTQDLASVELVRGPSSALYGANAFNGVLDMTTRSPRAEQGGEVIFTVGDPSSARLDALWNGEVADDWFVKLTGSYNESRDFTRSRDQGVEYAGLPGELVPVPNRDVTVATLGARVDRELPGGKILTVEAGWFDNEGLTVATGIGRVHLDGGIERPWQRVNLSAPRFNVLAYRNERDSPDQLALSSGGRFYLESENWEIEVQGNGELREGRIRLVGGASYKEEEIDTAGPGGNQTLIFAPVESDFTGLFAQADFELSPRARLVVAGRWDDSSLYDARLSPKTALVYSLSPAHTLRLSYNEAFQVANYSEFFLDAPTFIPTPAGPLGSIDLSLLEAALCAPFAVDCGFGQPTVFRALGNVDLEVEEIAGWEVGYTGILGDRAFVTVDYYNADLENFITDLQANPLGLVNPNFGPYAPPPGHPAPDVLLATLAGALGDLFAFLSNNVDGTPIFALASYGNAGQVDTQGVDLAVTVAPRSGWMVDFGYSWFDFDGDGARANTPEHKLSAGVRFTGSRFTGSLAYRWSDDFVWGTGAFVGPVDSYGTAALSGSYQLGERTELSLNVSNLLDDEHYQAFGGDLLGRRSLLSLVVHW